MLRGILAKKDFLVITHEKSTHEIKPTVKNRL